MRSRKKKTSTKQMAKNKNEEEKNIPWHGSRRGWKCRPNAHQRGPRHGICKETTVLPAATAQIPDCDWLRSAPPRPWHRCVVLR